MATTTAASSKTSGSEVPHRVERDSLGEMKVPADMLYGAQTRRAYENFPISGIRFSREFIRALGAIKLAAAEVNLELGLLGEREAGVIRQAATEVMEGKLDDHFVLDVFQTGSGTSSNMNANEVIANRAVQLLGGEIGSHDLLHPNDHVNMGQSSNDVIPTAIHVAALVAIEQHLIPSLEHLAAALRAKAIEFDDIAKAGRTHLQDATPIRLGQEFAGYASQIEHGIRRLERARDGLAELAIGGTAVGTGINTHPEFGRRMAARLGQIFKTEFREADDHFEAQSARDAVVDTSGVLKTIAVSLTKIANDIRWLSSGPRTGLGEIDLPAVQPGSSIMPGKVNPVMAEAVLMAAAQVIGNDTTVTIGGMSGNLELNVMMPVMVHNLLQAIHIMSTVSREFTDRCVVGITADEERCRRNAETTAALATALAPTIGYDKAAEVAKRSVAEDKTLRAVVLEMELLSAEELDDIIDFRAMTEPGIH